jgi:hypothetical protein
VCRPRQWTTSSGIDLSEKFHILYIDLRIWAANKRDNINLNEFGLMCSLLFKKKEMQSKKN